MGKVALSSVEGPSHEADILDPRMQPMVVDRVVLVVLLV